jgi:hypothetical protein
MQNMKERVKFSKVFCDCGARATLEDSSGPHCIACHQHVEAMRKNINEFILWQRLDEKQYHTYSRDHKYHESKRTALSSRLPDIEEILGPQPFLAF